MKTICMFVIDGQNDFCASGNESNNFPTGPNNQKRGSLCVEGADKEAEKVADFIIRMDCDTSKNRNKINKIVASLDSHHPNDCSHNVAWEKSDGSVPDPFTIVSHEDVKNGLYKPRFPFAVLNGKTCSSLNWALEYTKNLESGGRSQLCLWPVHCEIGSWGQNVYHPLRKAYDHWCSRTGRWIDYLTKGEWPFSEHYSALKADVPDPSAPSTQLNSQVLNDAVSHDIVIWTGWAGSHCLRWTVLDAINQFGSGKNELIQKSVFFTDACAPVSDIPGAPFKFSDWRNEFLDEVVSRGGQAVLSTDYLK